MELDFPIDSVDIKIVDELSYNIENPIYTNSRLVIDETDFTIKIDNVAKYHVQSGSKIWVSPNKNADQSSVQLFLNGSVLGAVLHQRGIIPFHGSSFEYQGKSILICGYSGSGKSSVTAAICQNGGHFINDDITPVSFNESDVFIVPIRTNIKLWDDTLQTLNIDSQNLKRIRPSMEKYYVSFSNASDLKQSLNKIIMLCTHNSNEYKVSRPSGIEKYNLLRTNIYRKMYLRGMPVTEKSYFKQLLKLAKLVEIVQVYRPIDSEVYSTMDFIREQIL